LIDVIISLIVGFGLGFMLLHKIKPLYAFAIVAVVGCLIGWQVLAVLQPSQTSLGYLLETSEMNLVWSQTHDMRQVAVVAKNGVYLWIGFNAVAAVLGYLFALVLLKRKKRLI